MKLKRLFSLKEDLLIVPINKAAINVAVIETFLCFNYYLDCHLSNQNENNTYTFLNNKTKDQISKDEKLYLSK